MKDGFRTNLSPESKESINIPIIALIDLMNKSDSILNY